MARAGQLARHVDITVPKFNKIVVVGHSYGSFLSLSLVTAYGNLVEGAVSTGAVFGQNPKIGPVKYASFGLEHARSNDRKRFSDRGSGYLVQATKTCIDQFFFKKGFFEKELLDYAVENRDTGTVAEFISSGSILGKVATEYTGLLFVSSRMRAGDIHSYFGLPFLVDGVLVLTLVFSLVWQSMTLAFVEATAKTLSISKW